MSSGVGRLHSDHCLAQHLRQILPTGERCEQQNPTCRDPSVIGICLAPCDRVGAWYKRPPAAHAAPGQRATDFRVSGASSTGPANGTRVSYGPSASAKGTQAQPAANPYCLGYVYANPGAPGEIAYGSSVSCFPDVIWTLQGVELRQCNNSQCSSYTKILDDTCDSESGEWSTTIVRRYRASQRNPMATLLSLACIQAISINVFLDACSNFPIYGGLLWDAAWDVTPN